MSKLGRPTKYKPEYCDKLKAHLADGLSFDAFAALIGVNIDTLYEWAKVYPEFSEAKKDGESLGLLFWEKVGRAGITGKIKGFNVAGWIFTMKNRFRWRDRHHLEHGMDDGTASTIVDLIKSASKP